MTDSLVPVLLSEARQVLLDHGWCQRKAVDDEGRHCAFGALSAAFYSHIPSMAFDEDERERLVNDYNLAISEVATAAAGVDIDRFGGPATRLVAWNDVPGRSAEEVLAAFDSAIESLSK